MGHRFMDDRPSWECWWPSRGLGRFWKRQYHKAMRQLIREHGGRERSIAHHGSECNWKTW